MLLRAFLFVVAICGSLTAQNVVVHATFLFDGEKLQAPATVVIKDGVIESIGRDRLPVPAGFEVVDIPGGYVMPHLVAADTGSGLGLRPDNESLTPNVQAADAWDPFAESVSLVREGIGLLYLSPGRSRLMPGQGGVVHTARDPEEGVVVASSALHVVLTREAYAPPEIYDPPVAPGPDAPAPKMRRQPPHTRAAAFATLRRWLAEARAASQGERSPHAVALGEPDLQTIIAVIEGKLPLRARAERAVDIHALLDVLNEYKDIDLIIEGGTEAHLVADRLAERQATVVLTVGRVPGVAYAPPAPFPAERGRPDLDSAEILAKAGVKVVLAPPPGGAPEDLLYYAGQHARESGKELPTFDALAAITSHAADAIGAKNHGRIAAGLPGDLLIFSSHPLSARAHPSVVFARGKVVHDVRESAKALAITAGRLYTASKQGMIENGTVVIENGKITAVGWNVAVPPGARHHFVDTLTPGLIDSSGQVGVRSYKDLGDGVLVPGDGLPAMSTKDFPSGSFDMSFPDVKAAAQAGVTTVGLTPAGGTAVRGLVSLVKTATHSDDPVVLKEAAGVALDYRRAPAQRANAGALRGFFKSASEYRSAWRKYEKALKKWESENTQSATPSVEQKLVPLPRPEARDRLIGNWAGLVYGQDEMEAGLSGEIQISRNEKGELALKSRVNTVTENWLEGTLQERNGQYTSKLEFMGEPLTLKLRIWRDELRGKWASPNGRSGRILMNRRIADPKVVGKGDKKKPGSKDDKDSKKKDESKEKKDDKESKGEKPKSEEKKPASSSEKGKPKAPKKNPGLDNLKEIAGGAAPLMIEFRSVSDAKSMIKICCSDYDLRTVVLSHDQVPDILDTLVENSAALGVTGNSVRREHGKTINPAAMASLRGVPVILMSGPGGDPRTLYGDACYLVHHGLSKQDALKAMTAWAALVLNVNDRIGTIEVGRDADLTLIKGSLFEPDSRVMGSVVDGVLVPGPEMKESQ